LVLATMGEPYHFVFDAGAVAGTDTFYLAGIQGRTMQVGPYDLMALWAGMGDMARLVGGLEGQGRPSGFPLNCTIHTARAI